MLLIAPTVFFADNWRISEGAESVHAPVYKDMHLPPWMVNVGLESATEGFLRDLEKRSLPQLNAELLLFYLYGLKELLRGCQSWQHPRDMVQEEEMSYFPTQEKLTEDIGRLNSQIDAINAHRESSTLGNNRIE